MNEELILAVPQSLDVKQLKRSYKEVKKVD
jgi:hypothetical protein